MTEFRSSRFLLWDKCHAGPFYDLIHQDTRGPVFDLGIHLDSYDGSVYIHQDDIIEMARTLGMATTEEVENMQAVIDNLRAQVNRLPKAEEALRNGLDAAVNRFYSDLHSDESDVDDSPNEPEQADDSSDEFESETIRAFKR
jgi:hypothetical protein